MRSPDLIEGVYETPAGWLGFRLQDGKLSALDWIACPHGKHKRREPHPAVRRLHRCLDRYFRSASFTGIPPLAADGTEFQKKVWRALMNIPCGSVKTYGQLASELKTGSRAIGQACRSNPIAVIIPCHRVVAAGHLGGYMGKSGHLHIKRWLLEHERSD